MTDQELFEGLANRDNQAFLYLYQSFQGKILHMIQNNNGTEADARDVFQEGVIALWTNIAQGKFVVQDKARLSTYLYALCKNIWISRLRKKKPVHSLEQTQLQLAEEVHDLEEEYEKVKQLEQQFAQLGEACKRILSLFYYQKASMREIAETLGLTEKTAKNNKYRCMQNLRSLYQTQPT